MVKSWHISTIFVIATIAAIFISTGMGAAGLGAILFLSLFPMLVWFGWTLHARSLYRNEVIEQRVMDRLRSADNVVVRRGKAADA